MNPMSWKVGSHETYLSDGVPLRPLDIGDLLDGTFTTIRRNPRSTVGLAALLVTLQQLLTVLFEFLF